MCFTFSHSCVNKTLHCDGIKERKKISLKDCFAALIPRFDINKSWKRRGIEEQGRIHGNPVADGWAGAVMRKPPYRPADIPTHQGVESRVRD